MKETLETINRMQADGVIKKYAIGGAVDLGKLHHILERHSLISKWQDFRKRYLNE